MRNSGWHIIERCWNASWRAPARKVTRRTFEDSDGKRHLEDGARKPTGGVPWVMSLHNLHVTIHARDLHSDRTTLSAGASLEQPARARAAGGRIVRRRPAPGRGDRGR